MLRRINSVRVALGFFVPELTSTSHAFILNAVQRAREREKRDPFASTALIDIALFRFPLAQSTERKVLSRKEEKLL